MQTFLKTTTAFLLVAAMATLSTGCTDQGKNPNAGSTPTAKQSDDDPSHGGWWCVEHGIPEDDCSLCSSTAAKKFKEKGDWCETHNRAESQCFKCDPERAKKFAKLYEAKVGRAPPEMEDE